MKRSADSAFVVEQLPSPESYPSSPTPSSSSSECPPRKRSRSEVTPEERREARAHRNRIAAQNSRDRRKAQFTYLERRVAELEEENRRLRVGKGSKAAQPSEAQKSEEREKDRAREKENEELRERIKTLENGWDAVVKALAASGLPLNVPTPPSTITSESSTASSRPLSTIPLIVPPTPISPTPSSISMSSSMFDFDDFESTRHLAAGGLATNQLELELFPSQPTSTSASAGNEATNTSPLDESAMEDLLREILAPSPTITPAPLPNTLSGENSPQPQIASSATQGVSMAPESTLDWEAEAEMQRLLDMLPDVQSDMNPRVDLNIDSVEFPSALDLELGMDGWGMGHFLQPPPVLSTIGVL